MKNKNQKYIAIFIILIFLASGMFMFSESFLGSFVGSYPEPHRYEFVPLQEGKYFYEGSWGQAGIDCETSITEIFIANTNENIYNKFKNYNYTLQTWLTTNGEIYGGLQPIIQERIGTRFDINDNTKYYGFAIGSRMTGSYKPSNCGWNYKLTFVPSTTQSEVINHTIIVNNPVIINNTIIQNDTRYIEINNTIIEIKYQCSDGSLVNNVQLCPKTQQDFNQTIVKYKCSDGSIRNSIDECSKIDDITGFFRSDFVNKYLLYIILIVIIILITIYVIIKW